MKNGFCVIATLYTIRKTNNALVRQVLPKSGSYHAFVVQLSLLYVTEFGYCTDIVESASSYYVLSRYSFGG